MFTAYHKQMTKSERLFSFGNYHSIKYADISTLKYLLLFKFVKPKLQESI